MGRIRALVLVLAGGAGGRLELLTRERAKPAVPYAGTHRLIDFPLSNALHSGLTDVWVAEQFNPVSLSLHLSNGRPWDLDRTTGGLLLLAPRAGGDEKRTGFPAGTADTLWRNAPLVRDFAAEALVVLSADAVYTMDYGALVEEHLSAGADVTMVTTGVDPADAGRYGVVQVEGGERVRDYVYKPDDPAGHLVSNEVFVFRPQRVLDVLDELADGTEDGSRGSGLQDLGDDLLPRLVQEGRAREHRFKGYWRDVGTVESYWSSHQELLGDDPPIDLGDPAWPVLTRAADQRAAARLSRTARVSESLLAPDSRIAGAVERSVIGRGAVVEEGAVVRASVVLPGAVVRAGAVVERAVLDDGTEVGAGARVGEPAGEITLVGLRARVPEGHQLPAGARYPDEGDADAQVQ